MGERPVNIGIVGAARVATYAMIAPARHEPRAHVLAIAARDSERGRAYAAEHGIPRVHESYDALFRDPEIELVYVATPPSVHARIAIAAIAAGKHVLVEKPFSMNADEAEAVARAGSAARVHVFEAMHSRHHRLFARMVEIVRSRELGKIENARAHFDAPIVRADAEFRWRDELGGGALMDLGVYPLAWLRGLLGEEVEVVSASATLDGGVDAEVSAELRFSGGVAAAFRASMIADRPSAAMELIGSFGSLRVTNPLAPQIGHLLEIKVGSETRQETIDGPATFAAQLAGVCATIRDGAPYLLPERDYVRSMALIDAVRRAARA